MFLNNFNFESIYRTIRRVKLFKFGKDIINNEFTRYRGVFRFNLTRGANRSSLIYYFIVIDETYFSILSIDHIGV